jgi:hypothetical protein
MAIVKARNWADEFRLAQQLLIPLHGFAASSR